MPDGNVSFLNSLRVARGNVDQEIDFAGKRPAGFASEGDEKRAAPGARFDSANYVGTFSAGRKRNQDVARRDQRFNLPLEYAVEAEVVGRGGEHGRIRGQSQSRKPRPVFPQPDDEFRGKMQGIGGASPVAEENEFPPGSEGLRRLAREFLDARDQAGGKSLLDAAAFLKLRDDVLPLCGHEGSAEDDLVAVACDAPRGVARVYNESGRFDDRLIVVAGMIGGDYDAVVTLQRLRIQIHRPLL